jgi:hypothetical protein
MPVAAPLRKACEPTSNGMRQTHIASRKVTSEPAITAIHAGARNTASRTSRKTTGISATRQVKVKLPSGSITCVNMQPPVSDDVGKVYFCFFVDAVR